MDEKPKLRPIEAFPVEYEGERSICLRDPQRITDQTIFINDFAFYIISQFDGVKSVLDIQADFARRTNEILPRAQIDELVQKLDEYYFLDNARFRSKMEQVRRDYECLDARPSSHAGISYPADPAELKSLLDSFYKTAGVAGQQGLEPGENTPVNDIKGILAPHIDIRHGGPCFAKAYSALRGRRPDLFVVIGIAHAMSENYFTVVDRDFETPLGTVPVDRSGVEILRSKLGDSIFAEEFEHRNEHSIEFQTVFLKHLYGDETPPPILPILCSSFHPMVESGEEPDTVPEVRDFLEALRAAVGARDVCWVGGVDLAHVGRRFGDADAPGVATCEMIEKRDRAMLQTVERIDATAFFNSIAQDGDARRVCGFPAIYIFLKSIAAQRGEVLEYEQMNDTHSGSVVSFAGMGFY